jgi:carboxyl-terminal processing protease
LNRFVVELGDGHTGIILPSELKGADFYVPFSTKLFEEGVFVTRVFEECNVKKGMRVVKVDGKPVEEFAHREVDFPFTTNSPITLRNFLFEKRLWVGEKSSIVSVEFEAPEGECLTIDVCRSMSQFPSDSDFSFQVTPNKIGIVTLGGSSFGSDKTISLFRSVVPELLDCNGVIIDLRNNEGGDSNIAAEILCHFIEGNEITCAGWKTRNYVPTTRAWGDGNIQWTETVIEKFKGSEESLMVHFKGPVNLLASNHTVSAGEDMLLMFRQLNRGFIIGQPTHGSTGQPLLFPLPGGGAGRVCCKKDTFADGTEFVGQGIIPDYDVPLSSKGLLDGVDFELLEAIRMLK